MDCERSPWSVSPRRRPCKPGRGVCGVPYLDRPTTQLAAAWECAGPLVRVPRAVYSPGGLAYGSGRHLS